MLASAGGLDVKCQRKKRIQDDSEATRKTAAVNWPMRSRWEQELTGVRNAWPGVYKSEVTIR